MKSIKRIQGYKRYLLMLMIVGLACAGTGIWEMLTDGPQENLQQLMRQKVGEGSREVQLYLAAENLSQEYTYSVTVEEQRLTEEQAIQALEEAGQELERVILGENVSGEAITTDLQIPDTLINGMVEVSCFFEPYDMIAADGRILWENLTAENRLIKVSAHLNCQEWEAEHGFYLQLMPPVLSEEEQLLAQIKQELEDENQIQGKEYLTLPEEIDGIPVSWQEVQESDTLKVLVLGLVCIVAYYVYEKERQERKQKEWQQKLILDYPDIVSQLSLLAGAGITISSAWGRMVQEYRKSREEGRGPLRPGYEEMLKAWNEMQDGVGEVNAYENFGRRCNQSQYRKLASLLAQNVRKGTRGMQQMLDAEALEAFELRKTCARQMGEEAGTRLLLPMGMMLLLVFAILMLPAMLSLGI